MSCPPGLERRWDGTDEDTADRAPRRGWLPARQPAAHDMDYARRCLLGELAAFDDRYTTVSSDYTDLDRWLPPGGLLVTYVAGPVPSADDHASLQLVVGGRRSLAGPARHERRQGHAGRTRRPAAPDDGPPSPSRDARGVLPQPPADQPLSRRGRRAPVDRRPAATPSRPSTSSTSSSCATRADPRPVDDRAGPRPVAARLRLRLRRRHLRPRRAGHAGPRHRPRRRRRRGGLRRARPLPLAGDQLAAVRGSLRRHRRDDAAHLPWHVGVTALPAARPQRHRVGFGRPFARPELIRRRRDESAASCAMVAPWTEASRSACSPAPSSAVSGRSTAASTSICSSNNVGRSWWNGPETVCTSMGS